MNFDFIGKITLSASDYDEYREYIIYDEMKILCIYYILFIIVSYLENLFFKLIKDCTVRYRKVRLLIKMIE